MILFGETLTPPMEIAAWLACLAFVVGVVNQVMKLVDRVKGPVQQPPSGELALRVSKLEDELKNLDQKMIDGFTSLTEAILQRNREGEDRASKIHSRIDPIAENTGEIKGQMHAFTKSFENFTTMMSAMIRDNR